jgi:hypothetical protein
MKKPPRRKFQLKMEIMKTMMVVRLNQAPMGVGKILTSLVEPSQLIIINDKFRNLINKLGRKIIAYHPFYRMTVIQIQGCHIILGTPYHKRRKI